MDLLVKQKEPIHFTFFFPCMKNMFNNKFVHYRRIKKTTKVNNNHEASLLVIRLINKFLKNILVYFGK